MKLKNMIMVIKNEAGKYLSNLEDYAASKQEKLQQRKMPKKNIATMKI